MSENEEDGFDFTRRDAMKAGGLAAAGLGLGGASSKLGVLDAEAQSSLEEETINTACWIGKMDCAMEAHKKGDRVVKFTGHPDEPRTGGGLCPKGEAQIAQVYNPYRIKAPLKRTNEKGQLGEWEEISWDQAMEEIGADLKEKLEDDPRRVVFQVGRKKSPQWHEDAWVTGTSNKYGSMEKYGHGATCSDSGYRGQELTFGTHGVSETDFKHCEMMIAWGHNITRGGGAHHCALSWPRQVSKARDDQGMRVISVDPQRRSAGSYADEWLPIEPGTDLAFWNAFNHVLVREGFIDEMYLTRSTNAPCLVATEGENEGEILRAEDAEDPAASWKWPRGELVWDEEAGGPVPQEEASAPANIALEGTYEVDGIEAKTAFQLYTEHVEEYTPEWAESIINRKDLDGTPGITAEDIERIAIEWGETAQIGATVEIDGEELPYRPVGVHGYHVAQEEQGVMATIAQYHASMLVGAVDAVGSTRVRKGKYDGPKDYRAGFRDLAYNPEKITPEPNGPSLGGSMFHPIDSGGYTQTPVSLNNPEKYNLPYGPEEMAFVVQMANPVMSGPNTESQIEAYSKLGTVVVVDPWMTATADVGADYVLPAATADKLEGPTGGWTGYGDISHIRFPAMEPMWDSLPDAEIFIKMADAVDANEEYMADLNAELGIDGTEYALDPEADQDLFDEPSTFLEEGLDRWAQNKGKDLDWFRNNVMVEEHEVGSGYRYAYTWGDRDEWGEFNPYAVKHDFYSETLLKMGDRVEELMEQEGFDESDFPYIQDYTAFPTWREPTMWDSIEEGYELSMISAHPMEHKQSRSSNNELLNEIHPRSHVRMNATDAAERGIEDGDEVVVTSHNAQTGDTYQIEGVAMVLEGLKPGVIDVPAHHGQFKDPVSEALDEGPNVNSAFPNGPGYIAFDNGQSFHVMTKVEKKGGDSE
jgi:anaerobic selenocysteine-containing dehydrogenase